jgi:alcohol dehydrogenase (NADP+)
LIGGIKRTQELLDFCAEKNVVPDTEMIHASGIDGAWEKLINNTAGGTRFVIDIDASKADAGFMPKE